PRPRTPRTPSDSISSSATVPPRARPPASSPWPAAVHWSSEPCCAIHCTDARMLHRSLHRPWVVVVPWSWRGASSCALSASMLSARAVILVLASLVPACADLAPFHCDSDAACVTASMHGTCEPNHYCSTADGVCPSGRRFVLPAGDNLGGQCVPDPHLIAYWRFDETAGMRATDASGNGNHADLAAGATFTAGKVGDALSVDGMTGYAAAPSSASF